MPEDRDRHPVCTRGLKKVYITTRCASQTKQAGFRTGRCKKKQPHTFDPAFGVEVLFSFRSLQREKRQSAPGANYLATTWPHTQKLFDYLAPPFRGLGAQRSVLKNVVSEGARSRSPLFNPGGGSRSNNEPLLHLRMKLVQQR